MISLYVSDKCPQYAQILFCMIIYIICSWMPLCIFTGKTVNLSIFMVKHAVVNSFLYGTIVP